MKTLRFLLIFLCYCLVTGCGFNQSSNQNQVAEPIQNLTIGDKEYSFSDIEEIVSFYEASQNQNDIDSAYFDTTIPIDAGGPIDAGTALDRMKRFRSFAQRKRQPHGFSFGLKTIDEMRAKIQKINDDALANGEPIFYTGIRIYPTTHKTYGEWNMILVGVRADGRDIFTGSKDWEFVGDPVYNSSLPCPQNCP